MLASIDWSVLQWIHTHLQNCFLDSAMPIVSALGNGGAVWIGSSLALICTKKYRKQGLILLAGLCVGVIVGNLFLKNLIARPRPCWVDTSVSLLIANPQDFSFPSGHALASTIGATILTMTNRKFGYVAIPLAVLIAFSRLYLYVHFPTDVLGAIVIGLLTGISVFFAGNKVVGRIETRFQRSN